MHVSSIVPDSDHRKSFQKFTSMSWIPLTTRRVSVVGETKGFVPTLSDYTTLVDGNA